MKTYKEFGGLYFSEDTKSYLLKEAICYAFNNKIRVRVWYGDINTGVSWNDENDICGYIGRSTGQIKIPLLINSRKSSGGGALSVSCIIKVVETQTKRVLYKHENFHQSTFRPSAVSDMPGYSANVYQDGEIYARCKSVYSAVRLAAFMNGERMCK